MAIGKDKTRYIISLEHELKTTLESLAENDNRSLNNYIVTILKEHVNSEIPTLIEIPHVNKGKLQNPVEFISKDNTDNK